MTPQNTTATERCALEKQKEESRESKNLHRFLVGLPLCIGIFNCAAGILAREVFMLALGVMALICALFIDLAMEGAFD